MVDESIKSAFETALNDANTAIANKDATAEELNNANKALQDSIKIVQIEKSKYEIVKNKIAENITVATELTTADDFTNYGTEDEQNNLTSKLESATSVKSAETSTYTELNTANTELKSAIDAYITAIKETMKEYIDVFEACLKGEGEYAIYKEYMTPAHEVQVEECVSEMNTLYNNPSATKAELVQEMSKAEEIFLLLEQDSNTGYMISSVKQSLSTAIEKTESANITNLEYYPYFIQQNADETKTAFETELQTAKDTLSTFDATYTMESVTADNGASLNSVANLANSLNSKRINLVNEQSYFVQYRSSILPDAIENANTVMGSSDFTNYSTEEKRTAIETAADALSALLADNTSYYSDLKSAETNLQNAISAYRDDKSKKQEEELNAARTALNETITTAQNIKNNKFYTYAPYPQFFSDESKKTTFEKALSDAEYLAARGYLMTVENCTAANNTLKNAIDDIKVESDNYINLKNQMKSTISTAETTVGYTDFDKCSTKEKRTALSSAISTAKGLDSKPYMSDLTSANQALNDALNDYNTDRAKVVEDLNTTLEEQLVEINKLIDDEYYPYYITGKYTQNSLEVTKENISNYTTKYLEGDGVLTAREEIVANANAAIQEATEQKSAYTSLKNELSELITSATTVTSASDFADYSTEEHRTALTEALTAANNTNSSNSSTYQNLTDAKTTLNNALTTYNTDKESSGGEEVKAAKETLKSSIASANAIKENEYYPYFFQKEEDKTNFEGVITYSQGIYDSSSSTLDQINTANDAITNSINNTNSQITVFNNLRFALSSNIAQATRYVNASDFNNYSTASVRSDLRKYLAEAVPVNDDKTSTYAQCFEAYKNLNTPLQTYTRAKVNG